jgi:Sec-independent protein translocase protein TatA
MSTSFALFNMGGGEIILVLALILILAGRILPNAQGFGSGIDEFRKGLGSGMDEVRKLDRKEQDEPDIWSRKEIFMIVTLVCLTVIEVLAVRKWLLQ